MLFIDMQKSEINERKRMSNKKEIFMQLRTKISRVCLMLVIWIDVLFLWQTYLVWKASRKEWWLEPPSRVWEFVLSASVHNWSPCSRLGIGIHMVPLSWSYLDSYRFRHVYKGYLNTHYGLHKIFHPALLFVLEHSYF